MARRLNRPRRRIGLAALVAAVAAAHLWLADDVLESRLGSGAADTRPRRIEVSFVRELAPAEPPAAPPQPAPTRRPARAVRPAPVASAASAAAAAQEPTEIARADQPEPEPPPAPAVPAASAASAEPEPASAAVVAEAASEAAAVPAAPASAASAAAAESFEWPPSTRLSYALTGNYRGPVEGQAHVEWLRSGEHYQVHLDISVGPDFAPLVSRRLSSDGELTEHGLRPRRYDEETKAALRAPRRLTIFFDDDFVHLPNGRDYALPPAVQDTASQFVQLTWLFTTQPQLLQPGRSIEIPLALPRHLDTWTYDVLARETLPTPAGAVETVHVKPRRQPKPGVELTAEMWIAPSLQYLPVRILIRQDAATYVDLVITRLPQQEAGR